VTERHVHFGVGYGPGLLDFLWDVDLLGKRVAYFLSSENEDGWSALDDVRFVRDNELCEVGRDGSTDCSFMA
jgi:hypothetical protein